MAAPKAPVIGGSKKEISLEESVFTVDGNQLTLLEAGPERLTALIGLIDGARQSLRILYYIYADDDAGQRVNAAMIAAARPVLAPK